jgi:XTP/dITP diphosphohydrolase
MKLVVASNNPGKLREFAALLAPLGWETVAQKDLGVAECAEPHHSFVENALEKARHAARCTGLPALADDSGLCVDALGGAPGVYSAHYAQTAAGEAKSDARNNHKLIADLAGKSDRRAHYVCVLVFVRHADDPQPIIAEGEWHGEIVDQARGDGGFGYDSHFYLPELGLTSAELDAAEKNRRSHRALALADLVDRLQARR